MMGEMVKKRNTILFCSENYVFTDTIFPQIKREFGLKDLQIEKLEKTHLLLSYDFTDVLIIIVDFEEKSISFQNLFQNLRRSHGSVPIIFICTKDVYLKGSVIKHPKIIDWLVKPFRVEEFFLKVMSVLEDYISADKININIEGYEYDLKINTLIDESGKKIKLTEKEVKVLSYLSKSGGMLVAKETLLRAIWGYRQNITTHTLETHIYRLRRKLEKTPDKPSLIVSGSGGYMLSRSRMVREN